MSSRTKPLDALDDPNVMQLIERTGVTDAPPPVGTFDNFGAATLAGLPRGYHEAEALTQRVMGNIGNRTIWLGQMLTTSGGIDNHGPIEEIDAGYEQRQQRIDATVKAKQQEAESYRPDPITTGAAGQIGNELAALLPRTIAATPLGPAGMAVAAGAPAGMSESAHLQEQGVAQDTADQAGLVTAVTTGVGAILPGGGFVKGAVKDTVVAAAANVGLGMANRGATGKLLRDAGYKDMAAQYEAFDSTAMATDMGFSLLLSGAHRLTSAQTDSTLANKNAEHMAHGDGLIATDGASGQAVDLAKTDAINAVLGGDAINVAGHVADAEMMRDPFHVPPELSPEVHQHAQDAVSEADLYDQATDRIVGLESGGKADAKNPRSTATGPGQFIDSTWLALMRKYGPATTDGMTDKQVLAMRSDPDLSRQMVTTLARENGAQLKAAGIEVTPANLYLAHHFGAGRVPEMLAKPEALMDTVLTAKELKANPAYKGKTVAEVMDSFDKRAGDQPRAARVASEPAKPAEPSAPEAVAARQALDDLDAKPESVGFHYGMRVAKEGDLYRVEDYRDASKPPEPQVMPRAAAESFLADVVKTAQPAKPEAAATLPPSPSIAAAQQLAADTPDHAILTGHDADNQPVYQPLHEAMTQIHEEHAAAVKESEAFAAGANCHLRRGAA